MWGAHEGMGWWMLFGGVFWVLFIVSLVYLFTSTLDRSPGTPGTHSDTPLEIAKRRLAAGEISHEEFDQLREKLR